MQKVYIVGTPYHLLISITKTIIERRIRKDAVIVPKWVASQSVLENAHVFFKDVIVKKEGVRAIADLIYLKLYISQIPLLTNLVRKKIKNQEDWFKKKEIYIFNDAYYYGCLLNALKLEYNLIEDGLNCYAHKRDEGISLEIKKRNRTYKLLNFSWECFGLSKYTKSIEVNDAGKIFIDYPNIIECNREQMFRRLKRDEIDEIAKVFDYRPLNIPHSHEASLLLTQPLSEDNIVNHARKIKIHKYLVDKYAVGTLYIKAHPRDKDDYSRIFPNAVILGQNEMPFEIYLLKENFHFRRVFSMGTSLMDAIFCADEKIQMDLNWVLNFK